MKEQEYDDIKLTANLLIGLCIVFGLLLIAISLLIPEYPFWHDLLRELGIVIFTVFAVSFLYETTVARKYEQRFLNLLRLQIEQGERNAAACAKLGIEQIFVTRDLYESRHPLSDLLSKMDENSTLRVVAKSLFQLMGRPDILKATIKGGSIVELCVFDPASEPAEVAKSFDLEISDIQSALAVFRKNMVRWLETVKPAGSLEIRYHRIPLNDSFLQISTTATGYCVWDISFGRDNSSKRIFFLDSEKPLGTDLANRYGRVWSEGVSVFKYSAGFVGLDKLPGGNIPRAEENVTIGASERGSHSSKKAG